MKMNSRIHKDFRRRIVYCIPYLSQGHHQLSGKSNENKSFEPNQIAPSIYIMIKLCYFSLDQWEIRIHLLWGKCFNIPHHCDPHLYQTKFNDFIALDNSWCPYTKKLVKMEKFTPLAKILHCRRHWRHWQISTLQKHFSKYQSQNSCLDRP